MALRRLQLLNWTLRVRNFSTVLGISRNCSKCIENELMYWRLPRVLCESQNIVPRQDEVLDFKYRSVSSACKSIDGAIATFKNTRAIPLTMAGKSYYIMGIMRSLATEAKAAQAKGPPNARQMGSFKVSMTSPGIIYEPYEPREPISFWRRCLTRSGWRRTKDDIIIELKSAYAIAKLRKSGYSKQKFYKEAVEMYKQINTLIATGDKTLLRKTVTDKLYSGLKNEIKARELMWSTVYWELVEPIIKIRTLRARLIGVDRNDTNKVFIQLTMEFLAKQKFEAYDSEGKVVAGDKKEEVI